jgi:CBS domain-containing protein
MTMERLIESRGAAIETCTAQTTVAQAAAILADRRIGALPVMEGERLVGMFSERDVIYRLRDEGASALSRTVGEVMTAPAVTVGPDTDCNEALSLMTRRRIRHLPVVRGDRMIGFVSIGDLVKQRMEAIESEAEAMRDYIQTA